MLSVEVRLNGTDENPYHRMGLTRNPFPQIAKYEYSGLDDLLANLASDPISDETDLRSRMVGASQEFIDLCVKMFKKGEVVTFTITFDD